MLAGPRPRRGERIAARQNRMKILLDECLPMDFRHSFPGHEAHSVEWAGLKGKKNGELLQAAEGGGYQVLLTVDQGIQIGRASCRERV